jgi:hypothetical protein
MNFDNCVSFCFGYVENTSTFNETEIFWFVEYEGGKSITIITSMLKGVADLDYLKYLVSKGGRFIDDKNCPIKETFPESNLIDFLYSPWVIKNK